MQPITQVAVIADLHDNDANLRVFLERLRELAIDELWIAGDFGLPETLQTIVQNFLQPIRVVPGNNERGHKLADYQEVADRFSHVFWAAETPAAWALPFGTLVMGHEPDPVRSYVEQSSDLITLAVAGHTHRPDLAKIGDTPLLNPGTLGGVFTPATYATITFVDNRPLCRLHRLYQEL